MKGKKTKLTGTEDTLEARQYFYIGLFGDTVNKNGMKKVKENVPNQYVQNRIQRDRGSNQHITIFIKPEMKKALKFIEKNKKNIGGKNKEAGKIIDQIGTSPKKMFNLFLQLSATCLKNDWKPLGIGKAVQGEDEVYYMVVDWPSAVELRTLLGMPEKDFHITIGFKKKDLHNVSKNEKTIVVKI